MAECGTCHQKYNIQGSDGEYVRPLCRCEAKELCTVCEQPSVQARLEDMGHPDRVAMYHCRKHGLSEYMADLPAEPFVEPPPPLPTPPRLRVDTVKKAVAKPAPPPPPPKAAYVPEPLLVPDRDDPELQFMTLCMSCEDVHVNGHRTYTLVEEPNGRRHYESRCPNCNAQGPSRYLDDPVPTKKAHGRKQDRSRKTDQQRGA